MRVLVTGAAGFLGSRLTERLVLGEDEEVQALVHGKTGGKVARLGRLPVDIQYGDVRSREDVREAIAGCDAVVHCAMGGAETAVEGTREVLDAAVEESVDTVVHLSSSIVHGRAPGGQGIDESAAFDPDDDEYSEGKAAAEKVVREYRDRHDAPVVVFRPGIIYGPFGNWSGEVLRDLRTGVVLAGGGSGVANLIYVDNLVDAILAALETPAARGEDFLAADDTDLAWREYYEAHSGIVGDHPPIRSVPASLLGPARVADLARRSVVPPLEVAARVARTGARAVVTDEETREFTVDRMGSTPWVVALYRRTPDRALSAAWEGLQAVAGVDGGGPPTGNGDVPGDSPRTEYSVPDPRRAALHTSPTRLSNRKMKEVLDWSQRIEFDEAIDLVGEWARYQRIVEPAGGENGATAVR